jgi:hypothetical protein
MTPRQLRAAYDFLAATAFHDIPLPNGVRLVKKRLRRYEAWWVPNDNAIQIDCSLTWAEVLRTLAHEMCHAAIDHKAFDTEEHGPAVDCEGLLMPVAKVSDEEFIRLFTEHGATETATRIGGIESNVYKRRRRLELKLKKKIPAPDSTSNRGGLYKHIEEHPARLRFEIEDGVVLVGSDAHYWPGIISTAHRALVHFAKKLKPFAVVMNGDVMDGAGISRHPSIGWEHKPTVQQEIEACSDRLDEIFKASPNSKHIWPLGNHDARFSTRLAATAPEFAKVRGVQLKDHFPGWQPCWSVWINDVVVKHRMKGGIHATHNNTMWAGKSMVTGHLHSLKTTPLTDYNGTRFGVDTGTLAEPFGPQFNNYCEDNSMNWRSGFAVLTFRHRRLMWPEFVHVLGEGEVEFRSEIIKV